MKRQVWTSLAALAFIGLGALPARAQLAPALAYVWGIQLESYNRHDVDATLRTIDSRSPDYAETKAALEQQFKDLDVKAEQVSFDLMGHDDEFAVARVKTKTTGKPGSGFTNNVVDAIVLFHQQDGTWKLWSEEVVAVEILP